MMSQRALTPQPGQLQQPCVCPGPAEHQIQREAANRGLNLHFSLRLCHSPAMTSPPANANTVCCRVRDPGPWLLVCAPPAGSWLVGGPRITRREEQQRPASQRRFFLAFFPLSSLPHSSDSNPKSMRHNGSRVWAKGEGGERGVMVGWGGGGWALYKSIRLLAAMACRAA